MSGQYGDSTYVSDKFISSRQQFRHKSSRNVVSIIIQANQGDRGAIWISGRCSRSFQVNKVGCVFFLRMAHYRKETERCEWFLLYAACQDISLNIHIDLVQSPLHLEVTRPEVTFWPGTFGVKSPCVDASRRGKHDFAEKLPWLSSLKIYSRNAIRLLEDVDLASQANSRPKILKLHIVGFFSPRAIRSFLFSTKLCVPSSVRGRTAGWGFQLTPPRQHVRRRKKPTRARTKSIISALSPFSHEIKSVVSSHHFESISHEHSNPIQSQCDNRRSRELSQCRPSPDVDAHHHAEHLAALCSTTTAPASTEPAGEPPCASPGCVRAGEWY